MSDPRILLISRPATGGAGRVVEMLLRHLPDHGITGTAAPDPGAVHAQVARIKQSTDLPVAVGFGVKTPEQARAIAEGADGVVVGSALVEIIRENLDAAGKGAPDTVKQVSTLVQRLAGALRAPQGVAAK